MASRVPRASSSAVLAVAVRALDDDVRRGRGRRVAHDRRAGAAESPVNISVRPGSTCRSSSLWPTRGCGPHREDAVTPSARPPRRRVAPPSSHARSTRARRTAARESQFVPRAGPCAGARGGSRRRSRSAAAASVSVSDAACSALRAWWRFKHWRTRPGAPPRRPDDLGHVGVAARAVDRPVEAGSGDYGQPAAVVEVPVGQHDRVHRRRLGCERIQLARRLLRRPWNIPQSTSTRRSPTLSVELRAGDTAGSTEELDGDRHGGRSIARSRPGRSRLTNGSCRHVRPPRLNIRHGPRMPHPADIIGRMSLPFDPPLEPMLAKPTPEIPTGDGWTYEPKWDGFRAIAFRDGPRVFLQSRDRKPLNRYFPELDAPLLALGGADARFVCRRRGRHRAAGRRARLRLAAHPHPPRRVARAHAGRGLAGIVRRVRLPGRW